MNKNGHLISNDCCHVGLSSYYHHGLLLLFHRPGLQAVFHHEDELRPRTKEMHVTVVTPLRISNNARPTGLFLLRFVSLKSQ